MAGSDKVLVYHYRHNGSPVVKDGLAIMEKHELAQILSDHPNLQKSVKSLPRAATTVDIHQRDLLTPSQASSAEAYPNADANIASVKMPMVVMLESAFAGAYSEMVILSKKL